jgi:hypothetical protein
MGDVSTLVGPLSSTVKGHGCRPTLSNGDSFPLPPLSWSMQPPMLTASLLCHGERKLLRFDGVFGVRRAKRVEGPHATTVGRPNDRDVVGRGPRAAGGGTLP